MTYAIATPILYRTLSINYYDGLIPGSRSEERGLNLRQLERILEMSDSTLRFVKEFEVRLADNRVLPNEMGSPSDHLLMKFVLKRFRDGQLNVIR